MIHALKFRPAIALLFFCVFATACNDPSSPPASPGSGGSQVGASTAVCTKWPRVCGQAGPYAALGGASEIQDISDAGFRWLLTSYPAPDSAIRAAMTSTKIGYIDNAPADMVYSLCQAQLAAGAHTCVLSAKDETAILSELQAHLNETASDPNLIAYWILDDYPGGNVIDIDKKIRAAIYAANASLKAPAVARPTICGFGGVLDTKTNVGNDSWFKLQITNFSKEACDFIALYPYAENSTADPALIDWSMGKLLPRYFKYLKAKGWDPSRQPFIGMPGAFTFPKSPGAQNQYVLPTAADLELSAQTYCQNGAVSLLPYTWDDTVPGNQELHNRPDLVTGLQNAVNYCELGYWQGYSAPLKFDPPVATVQQGSGNQLFRILDGVAPFHFRLSSPSGAVDFEGQDASFPNEIWPNNSLELGVHTITAVDATGRTGTAAFVVTAAAPLSFSPSFATAKRGAGNQLFQLIGGVAPISFKIVSASGTLEYQGQDVGHPDEVWPNKSLPLGTHIITGTDALGSTGSAVFVITY